MNSVKGYSTYNLVTLAMKARIVKVPILILSFRIFIDRLLYELMTTKTDRKFKNVRNLEPAQAFKIVLYAEKGNSIKLLTFLFWQKTLS